MTGSNEYQIEMVGTENLGNVAFAIMFEGQIIETHQTHKAAEWNCAVLNQVVIED